MQTENEVSELIHADKKKKTVTWNDQKTEGKIEEQFLEINQAAMPSKAVMDKAIRKLIDEKGYPEIEATSMVGKPITPSGEIILNHPTFYESKEKIRERVALKQEKENGQNQSNPYSFFTMVGVGVGVALAATVIGITISKTK